MIRANRDLGALLAAIVVLGTASLADAGTKEGTVNACKEAIKQEFGESPVEFGKFNRTSNRNNAFGELTLSDGSKAEIRCQVFGGKVLNVQFRGSNRPGQMWLSERPSAAIFVEPKDEKDGEKDAAAGKSGKDDAEKGSDKENTAKTVPGAAGEDGAAKSDTAKKVDRTSKDTAEKKSDDADKDTTAKTPDGAGDGKTAKAEDGPVKPLFKKVPKN